MTRVLLVTLVLSLAANAVFLVRASRPITPPASAEYPVFTDTASQHAQTAPAFSSTGWSSLQDASPHARDFLRQLGLSDPEIRAIVRADVDARYAARERALRKSPAYWERTFSPQLPDHLDKITDPAAVLALALQKETEIRQLLGDAYERPQGFASYLPFEKAWRLNAIYDDYLLIKFEASGRSFSLQLPVPRGQTRYLDDQRRADIEALLTPEELRAHDLRTSSTASHLRNLAGFDATEQEFLALYDLRKPLESLPNSSSRDETQKLIEQQTHDLLGEKRYADYTRAEDPDFRLNRDLVTQLGLPPETALAGYEVIKSLQARSTAFAAQNKTTSDQRDAFHAQLLQESETTLTKLYGEKGLAAARDLIRNRLSRDLLQEKP